jgi:hypothetical protein
MKRLITTLVVVTAIAGSVLPGIAVAQSRGAAQTHDEQDQARRQMQAGRNMSIRDIERRILPQMNGDEYIGFEYDPAAGAYRLKFIREGRVIWVDVDARTARVLRVSR